jgi:hypothetical protein
MLGLSKEHALHAQQRKVGCRGDVAGVDMVGGRWIPASPCLGS